MRSRQLCARYSGRQLHGSEELCLCATMCAKLAYIIHNTVSSSVFLSIHLCDPVK